MFDGYDHGVIWKQPAGDVFRGREGIAHAPREALGGRNRKGTNRARHEGFVAHLSLEDVVPSVFDFKTSIEYSHRLPSVSLANLEREMAEEITRRKAMTRVQCGKLDRRVACVNGFYANRKGALEHFLVVGAGHTMPMIRHVTILAAHLGVCLGFAPRILDDALGEHGPVFAEALEAELVTRSAEP